MSCEQRIKKAFSLFVVVVYFHVFPVCYSVSLAKWEKFKQDSDVQQGNWRRDEQSQDANLRTSDKPRLQQLRPESVAFSEEPFPYFSIWTHNETGSKSAPSSLSWVVGNISVEPSSSSLGSEYGYQADVTGFHGDQGKVWGPSFDSGPRSSEWLAMRPLVQCDDDAMTFTASGQGFAHLLVDRGGSSPISLFQLPPYCGYSVRMSWSDLEVMVPFDACYVTHENGSHVLPLLWWGSPLKLSCPVQMFTPAPSSSPSTLSVFCSPYSMAVQTHGQEQDILLLGVMVNGGWGPFVSEECAYHVHSQPEELTFYIPYSAPCITIGDSLYVQFITDDQGYKLSCPVPPQFPSAPSPPSSPTPSPGDPQFPYFPDVVSHALPTPPPPPHIPDYSYPGLQYPQLPQVYPPGPQPPRRPQPTSDSPPGHQPQQQQFLYPTGLEELPSSPGEHPELPSLYYQPSLVDQTTSVSNRSPTQGSHSHQAYKLSPRPSQYPSALPYPYDEGLFYPPSFYSSHYPYGPVSYPNPDLEVQPLAASHPTTRITVPKKPDSPPYPSGQFYPFYFPSLLAAKEKPPTIPQKLTASQATCPPGATHSMCTYYTYPYYPHHPLHYPPVPQYRDTQLPVRKPSATTTSAIMTATVHPTPEMHHLRCLTRRMVIFLPFAHPDSIQVRDHMKKWLFLFSVSPLCGYRLQMGHGPGVILHSPLPACHSKSRSPATISLTLRFWDLSMAQYRTVDLQCPYESTPETPEVVSLLASPSPPSTTKEKISPFVVPKPKVSCSYHRMTVELPSGPISGIVVKDMKGNQMKLQDAPKHCGYSVIKGKDGQIRLSLQLHSRCRMSVQGQMYIITVVYMTVNGQREAQLSCPLVIPGSGKECELPSEQRLPCGPSSVSQPQCLSVGCCFSKYPPACYYPMDECTIDRHFVFLVPATLTEPPLSPAFLTTADNSACKPQRVTSEYALFKIPIDGCGTRRVTVGKAVIYMVEVISRFQAISLNYGTITRSSPVRLLVECHYLPDTVLTVGYLVKTPTLGPGVQTQGIFGVQLRIAKDGQYSSYYPQYHQPLQMLLGKPLYLEVRLLNAPDPSLVLLVHFCVAYPRSGNAVWVLLYNGCPNPLDPALKQAVLPDPQPPSSPGQTRRFTISTFQFLPDGDFKDLDEEIYFMCSTEVCSPRDGPCVEGCFGQRHYHMKDA
uniref:ZP domain-containing protein n=1 Tax=Monopterus albus TaxID=43700 RepID=A0A3Q3IKG2_MONAL|nr:uncharacterized protein LOC109958484 [Monopterus albus]